MRRRMYLTCLLYCLSMTTAHADWREASSDHFVIYADESERELRNFSEKLERYHSAMKAVFPAKEGNPSPSNRVTVYIVRNEKLVRELYGDQQDAKYIQGFYIARAGGSLAIIPPIDSSRSGEISESERILMHEYAHHFMAENAPYLVPRWFGEGFAEFFSSAKFDRDGTVGLGLPANHRAYELQMASDVSIEELLDTAAYAARKSDNYNNFYGRAWLLFHYIYMDQGRRQTMVDYLNRLNTGESELAAATAAFGDLQELDKALNRYQRQSWLPYIPVPPEVAKIGPVNIREMGEAEAASMAVRVRSKRGVDQEQAAKVVLSAREVAEQYPNDAEVLAALAEAEYDSGRDVAAIAAADRALAINPSHINALIQKGYALARTAKESTNPVDGWALARKHFVSINKIEADHPIPLLYYYLSFAGQGAAPSENAIRGLEWALELAPYDANLRMMTAQQQMIEQRYADAIDTLGPMAHNPHLGTDNPALALLETAKKELATRRAEAAQSQPAP